jgi:hypothetical protein
MSVRINAEQAVDFVRYALDGAVPGVSFDVQPYADAQGRPGVRARATARGYGERIYLFPPASRGEWDAQQLVSAAVQQITLGVGPHLRRAA